MGTHPKFEATPMLTGIGKVAVIDGRQVVLLPENMRIYVTELDIVQFGSEISMTPARKRLSDQEIEQWKLDMQKFQEELGDLLPEGRNQPPMPEPTKEFKKFFGFED